MPADALSEFPGRRFALLFVRLTSACSLNIADPWPFQKKRLVYKFQRSPFKRHALRSERGFQGHSRRGSSVPKASGPGVLCIHRGPCARARDRASHGLPRQCLNCSTFRGEPHQLLPLAGRVLGGDRRWRSCYRRIEPTACRLRGRAWAFSYFALERQWGLSFHLQHRYRNIPVHSGCDVIHPPGARGPGRRTSQVTMISSPKYL